MAAVIVKLFLLPFLPSAFARNISLKCWEDVTQFLSDLNAANPKPYAIKSKYMLKIILKCLHKLSWTADVFQILLSCL